MSKTPMYDPGTSEARSPWLAGLTEACNKLSGILDMQTDRFTDLHLSEVFISNTDRCRIYQAPLGNKLWLQTPAPVIRKNGIVITPNADNFTIDYLGGSIAFDYNNRLKPTDVVTADATYIVESSGTISDILSKLADVSDSADKFKGYFLSYEALVAAYPSGITGDFAIVGGDENTFYIWNSTSKSWENIVPEIDLSDYYTIDQTDGLLSKKENNIPSKGDTTEADDYYLGGRKTWQNLHDKVLGSTIGERFDTSDASPVSPDDTLAEGIGKLQAQVNNYTHDLFGTGAPETTTEGKIGQDYTNTSNGDKYHLTSIENGEYNWEKYVDSVTPSAPGNIPLLSANGQLIDSGKNVEDVGRNPISYKFDIPLSDDSWTHLGGSTWEHKEIASIPNWDNRLITANWIPSKWKDENKTIIKALNDYSVNLEWIESVSDKIGNFIFHGYFGDSNSVFNFGAATITITLQYAELKGE